MPRFVGALGLIVLVGSIIWMLMDSAEDDLPEGAIAGASFEIVVGDAGGWPWTLAETGIGVGGLLLIVAVVWALVAKRRAKVAHEG